MIKKDRGVNLRYYITENNKCKSFKGSLILNL